jgi:hypothetical protein
VHERLRDLEPRPSSPSIVLLGTRTFSNVTSAWSLGMLNVHHMNSTRKPFECTVR